MNMKKVFKVALGTSLFLVDQLDHATKSARERVGDQVDDICNLAQDGYSAAADRVGRASRTLGMGNDNRAIWNVARFAAGVGIGVGVGLLVAPAKGQETRTKLAGKAQELGANVRRHFASADLRATATGD